MNPKYVRIFPFCCLNFSTFVTILFSLQWSLLLASDPRPGLGFDRASCLCFLANCSDAVSGMYWALDRCQCSVADYCLWHFTHSALTLFYNLHCTELYWTFLSCVRFFSLMLVTHYTAHKLFCYCFTAPPHTPPTLPIIACDTCNHSSDRCFRSSGFSNSLSIIFILNISSGKLLKRTKSGNQFCWPFAPKPLWQLLCSQKVLLLIP